MILAALSILAASADLTIALKAKDQALLDAVAPGGREAWSAVLAPQALYVDENGRILDRATFLKELEPLPPGVSGHIKIDDYRVEQAGDVALVVFHADEFEEFHGQHLTARYLMSETWTRQGGDWKLATVHCYATLRPPAAITLPAAALDAYAGRYEAGPDLVYVIARDGDHLIGGREGKPAKPLAAETPDVLFAPDQLRIRKIFRRDAAGRITGFVDRREGGDLVWRRIP